MKRPRAFHVASDEISVARVHERVGTRDVGILVKRCQRFPLIRDENCFVKVDIDTLLRLRIIDL